MASSEKQTVAVETAAIFPPKNNLGHWSGGGWGGLLGYCLYSVNFGS